MTLRAVILMDGLDAGRRLLPADDHPALQLVDGVPIADRLVRHLVSQGVVDLCLIVHHLPGLVAHYFADGAAWGARISYVYQERLLGSAGALAQAADFCVETTLFVSGTLSTDASISPMADAHRLSSVDVTVALGDVSGSRLRPVVTLDESTGHVVSYLAPRGVEGEPPPGHMTDAGVYLLEPAVVRELPQDTVLDWTRDVMPSLVEQRRVQGWPSKALCRYASTSVRLRLAGDLRAP